MKKTLIPLLVVASIALMITGCCLGKDDVVHDTDPRYKIKYKNGDTLVYKADNGQTDTFVIGGGLQQYNTEYYDCYTEQSLVYLYSLNRIPPTPPYIEKYITTDYENSFSIGNIFLGYNKSRDKYTIIDTILNGVHYREMFHFYTARHHEKTIPSYLLYDLTYNTGIVQYRDTLGVMWTLQENK